MGLFLMVKFIFDKKNFGGGRAGESASHGITEDLINASKLEE
jgi:tRNA uridine 5-carboxymethylaminomethyl modification enzyme